MAAALEWSGNRCEEEEDKRERKANDELHRGTGADEHTKADEKQLQRAQQCWVARVGALERWDGAAEGQRTFLKISTSSHQNINGE